jgi:hypothetical protein
MAILLGLVQNDPHARQRPGDLPPHGRGAAAEDERDGIVVQAL